MRILIRCVIWTGILGFVLLAGLLWFLQQPICRDWIQQRLSEQVEGEISFQSVGLSWTGALKLNHVEYQFGEPGNVYQLSSQSLQLDDLIFGRPHLYLRNIDSRFDDEQVLSASRGVIAWPDSKSDSPYILTFHQAEIDFFPLLKQTKKEESKPSSTVASPTMRIEIVDSNLKLPWKITENNWNASIDVNESANRVKGLVNISPLQDRLTKRLSVSLDVEPNTQRVHSIHLNSDQYPLSIQSPFVLDSDIKGDIRLEPLGVNEYKAIGEVSTTGAYFSFPEFTTVVSGDASASVSVVLSSTYAIQSMQAKLKHAPILVDLATNGIIPMPTGNTVLSVTQANTRNAITKLDWSSDTLGSFSLSSKEWPPNSTSEYNIQFSLPTQKIKSVRRLLPGWIQDYVPDIPGSIAMQGNLNLSDKNVKDLKVQADLVDGEYEIAGVNFSGLRLKGPLNMDASKLSSVLSGSAKLRYPLSVTQVIDLDISPKNMAFSYDRKNGSWSFKTPTFDAKPLRDVSVEFKDSGEWTASAQATVDELLPAIQPMLIPDVTRTIEGMGSLVLSASGDADIASIRITSPDLALYSFDQEPAVGMQLRDVDLRYLWEQNAQGGLSNITLTAATPYFSYSGNDIEWPGKQISLKWEKVGADWNSWKATLFPPGGGMLGFDYSSSGASDISANSISLAEFAIPLLSRFVLGESTDDDPLIRAKGFLNGELSCASITPLMIAGMLDLSQLNLDLDVNPSVHIEGASISTPIAYPIKFDLMPSHEIHFLAEKTRIDEASFQNVDAVIPITETHIPVIDSLVMPIYGGRTAISNLQIHDWQTSTPLISGGIQFDNLNLEDVAKAFPVLPGQGQLNGQLESIRVSSEVLEATGQLVAKLFGGSMTMKDFSLTRSPISAPIWKMDAEFKKLDLEKVTNYFDYGKMTGQISGSINSFEMFLPKEEGEWPYPRKFDITIKDDMKGMGMVSKDTLQKIINLGESSGLKKLVADRDVYLFSKLGLKAQLDGNDLKLYGTLRDNLFLETDEINVAVRRLFNPNEWFAIPVNINLAKPDDVIPFDRVWQRLMSQIEGESP
jgi:hypothetical protein